MLSNLNIRHTQKLLRHGFKITPGGHCHNKVTLKKVNDQVKKSYKYYKQLSNLPLFTFPVPEDSS